MAIDAVETPGPSGQATTLIENMQKAVLRMGPIVSAADVLLTSPRQSITRGDVKNLMATARPGFNQLTAMLAEAKNLLQFKKKLIKQVGGAGIGPIGEDI